MANQKSASTAQGCGCLAAIVVLLIIGAAVAWSKISGGPSAPAAKTATAAAHSSSSPATVCSGKHWPQPVPRVAGQTLFDAGDSVSGLLCFNVVAAYALGDRHDVTNDPANTASEWVIGRVHPGPGTLVTAKTPITLYVHKAPAYVPAPSPAAPPSSAAAPPPAPAPASPAGCYPLSNSGNCYEPGEYCRASDQGVTGVAGDGTAIVCQDNNGLRWEPTG